MWDRDISFDDDKLQDIFKDVDSLGNVIKSSNDTGPLTKRQKFDSVSSTSKQNSFNRQPLCTIWTSQTDSTDTRSQENRKVCQSLAEKTLKLPNAQTNSTNPKPQTDHTFIQTRGCQDEKKIKNSSGLSSIQNQRQIKPPNSSIMSKSQLPAFLQVGLDDDDLDLSANWSMDLSFSNEAIVNNSSKVGAKLHSNISGLKSESGSHSKKEVRKNFEITKIDKQCSQHLEAPVSSDTFLSTSKQTKNHSSNFKADDDQVDYDAFFDLEFDEDILVSGNSAKCKNQHDSINQNNRDKKSSFNYGRNVNINQESNFLASVQNLRKTDSRNSMHSNPFKSSATIQPNVESSTRETENRPSVSKKNINSSIQFPSSDVKDLPLLQTRKRRFPGPAGLLPKLPSDQSLRLPDFSHIDELIPKSPSVSIDKMDLLCSQNTMDEFQKEPWTKMEKEFGLDSQGVLLKFTISWLNNQASLKQLPQGKMPFLAVVIKSISINGQAMTAFLKDKTGEIQGTFQSCLTEDYHCLLNPGSVIVLRQTGVFSPTPRKHYLNITKRNIFCIYNIQEETTVCKKVAEMTFEELNAEVQRSNSSKRSSGILGEQLTPNFNIQKLNISSPSASFLNNSRSSNISSSISEQNHLHHVQHKANNMSPNFGRQQPNPIRPIKLPVGNSQGSERNSQYMPVPSSYKSSVNAFVNITHNPPRNSPVNSNVQNRISKTQCQEEIKTRISDNYQGEMTPSFQNTTKPRFQFKSASKKTFHECIISDSSTNKVDHTPRNLKLDHSHGLQISLTEESTLADDELDELLQGISEEELFGLT